MKYYNENTRPPSKAKGFSQLVPVWEWSDEKQCPVVAHEENQQEKIQSYEDCALHAIFDKFLPDELRETYGMNVRVEIDEEAPVQDRVDYGADIDALNLVAMEAEAMRKRYGLPEDMSYGQIFAKVQELATNGLRKRNANNHSDTVGSQSDNSGSDNVVSNNPESVVENNKPDGNPVKGE